MDEAAILEGLAEALWRDALGPGRRELWEDEYEWVRVKWRRYARIAIVYLAEQRAPADRS